MFYHLLILLMMNLICFFNRQVHNEARAAVGNTALEWDDTLSAMAQVIDQNQLVIFIFVVPCGSTGQERFGY